MNKEIFIRSIKASIKEIPCDLVIKNINIVDVFQSSTFTADVAISNGYIVGIGDYKGEKEIDGTGKFICPGLIDAHAHIESSFLTPDQYYLTALLHGVTSMIVDPHEIANVLGSKGIDFMLSKSLNIPFDFYFMLPSCVPATSFENSGAVLNSSDLKPFYSNNKILGLAEVMDFPSVINCKEDMVNKLLDAIENKKIIDGHAAGFSMDLINAYTTANIITDHECHTSDELIEKIRRGMYVLIREGTVAKNLNELIKGVSPLNSRRLCLCTDDKHIDDIIKNGTIDNSIKMCINHGIIPEIAIQMATLNTCECYKIDHKGAIAPGYIADFLILDDLNTFSINSVYKNGKLVVKDNKLINIDKYVPSNSNLPCTMNFNNLTKDDLKIDIKDKTLINVIEIIPNKLESNHLKIDIKNLSSKDEFIQCTNSDLLKIAVIERHNNTGNIGLGIIKGLKLKSGAIATTVAHDSHNLIVCGTNDSDMLKAIENLKDIGGGVSVCENGKILASLPLEIGGLITERHVDDVLTDLKNLHDTISVIAPNINFNPFLTLSFLSLPVIPSLKITDKGLFNVDNFSFINVAE